LHAEKVRHNPPVTGEHFDDLRTKPFPRMNLDKSYRNADQCSYQGQKGEVEAIKGRLRATKKPFNSSPTIFAALRLTRTFTPG
jgi:hypothetical protein